MTTACSSSGGSILGVIVLGIFVAAVGLIVVAYDVLVQALKRLVPWWR